MLTNSLALLGNIITNTATITASNDLTPTNNSAEAVFAVPSFQLVNRTPGVNEVGVANTGIITAGFNADLDITTVTALNFAVHTAYGGMLTSGISADGDTITLEPERAFFPGERVQVIASKAIQNSDGAVLDPIQWGFIAGPVTNRCVAGFTEVSTGLPDVSGGGAAWGDYDNDGDLDILLTGYDGTTDLDDISGRIRGIYRNTSGNFNRVSGSNYGLGDSSVAWGDYDRDGDLDILLTGTVPERTFEPEAYLLRNDGGGSFNYYNPGLPDIAYGSVAWGDYDNDGDLDILLFGQGRESRVAQLWRNSNGAFRSISIDLPGVRDGEVAWGDYDNDGDLDILLMGKDDTDNRIARVYRNDGALTSVAWNFTDIDARLTAVDNGSVAWGDYDNDGDLDILLTGQSDSFRVAQIYRNDSGTFALAANLSGISAGSAAWGDYDNDGDLDVLLMGTGHTSLIARIYRNDSTSELTRFTDIDVDLAGVWNSSVAWGDYDNDGDLDILLTGRTDDGLATKLYRNDDCPADVQISKSVVPTSPFAGDTVTYTLAFSNLGPDTATGVEIRDSIPVSVTITGVTSSTFGSGESVLQISPEPNFAWSFGDLSAGAGGFITLTGTLSNSADILGAAVKNTATILANSDTDAANNSSSVVLNLFHLTGHTPLTNAVGIATEETISASFDWSVDAETVSANSFTAHGAFAGLISGSFDVAGDTITLDPDRPLFPGERVQVSVSQGIQSTRGGNLAQSTQWGFNVGPVMERCVGGLTELSDLPAVIGSDSSVTWGDYDNDGDLDILVAGFDGSNRVSRVYRNDSGSFTDIDAGLAGVNNGSVAWGDYDNDGDLDILITGEHQVNTTIFEPVAQLYRNDGGSFTDINAGLTGVQDGSVAWGDYDNDGDLDILLTGDANGGRMAQVYRNDPSAGSDRTFTDINAGLTGVFDSSVAWGDYDNDGDLDILLSGRDSSFDLQAILYRNNGNDSFNAVNAGLTDIRSGSVSWGDYDNDGDLDIFLSGNAHRTVFDPVAKLYRNDGGTFIEQIGSDFPFDGVWQSNAAWGDYDNDGDLDILVAGNSGTNASPIPTAHLYRNDGGSFVAVDTDLSGIYRGALDWGDYDNDGDLDILLTGSTSRSFIDNLTKIYRNDDCFTLLEYTPATNALGVDLAANIAADFDAEVNPATVNHTSFAAHSAFGGLLSGTLTASGSTITLDPDRPLYPGERVQVVATQRLQSTRDAVLVPPTQWGFTAGVVRERCVAPFSENGASFTGLEFSSGAWGDYDNDGDLDILVAGADSGGAPQSHIYRNDGNGGFSDIGAGLVGTRWGGAAWGDYDNDGDLDILVSGLDAADSTRSLLYRNDEGSFSAVGAGLPGIYQGGVAWGDYNNDGNLDILLTGTSGSGSSGALTKLYRNDGASGFQEIAAGLPNLYRSSVAWGDYDNDGDLDILLTGGADDTQIAHIYHNDGGIFTRLDAGLTGVWRASAAWGDYDNDGDLDILVTGRDAANTRVYRNDGGAFTDITAGLPAISLTSVAWGDYDNDGDLDILTTGLDENNQGLTRLYRNDTGAFVEDAELGGGLTDVFIGSGAWGDYDNDGDLDILLSGRDSAGGPVTQIYRNNNCPDDDGVDEAVEDAVPNPDGGGTGDGNGDGIPDKEQAEVSSLPNAVDGSYVTLVSESGAALEAVAAVTPAVAVPAEVALPQGMLTFQASGLTAGSAHSMTLILHAGAVPTEYWKYGPTPANPTDHWYDFSYDGTTGAIFNGNRITLHFVDGLRGDSDLSANGVITDPGGPAQRTVHYRWLPNVANQVPPPTGPDLVVERLLAAPDGVQVVIKNVGESPSVEHFWVDVYIEPDTPPTGVNQIWTALADRGVVWGVTRSLAPAESLTLSLNDPFYASDMSFLGPVLSAGQAVYAQVDSWNPATDYGAIREEHEVQGQPYNNITQTTVRAGVRMEPVLANGGSGQPDWSTLPERTGETLWLPIVGNE